jgi:hypothetical protein
MVIVVARQQRARVALREYIMIEDPQITKKVYKAYHGF